MNPIFKSKAFRDALPDKIYGGEEYLVRATADDISVYNLFSNNLIASYAASFVQPPKQVLSSLGGMYCSASGGTFLKIRSLPQDSNQSLKIDGA